MRATVVQAEIREFIPDEMNSFSFMQRYVLRRTHPRALFLNAVAATWFFYFMWHNSWQGAAASILIFGILAYLSVGKVNYRALAESSLGRIGLLHLHPMNLLVQSVGGVMVAYGVWTHRTFETLVGVSLVFLGHLWGWARVDSRY